MKTTSKTPKKNKNIKVIGRVVPEEEIYPITGAKIIRPKINYPKIIVHFLFILAVLGGITFCLIEKVPFIRRGQMSWGGKFALVYLALFVITTIICRKRIVIFILRLYQKYAPYEVRSRCVFIPNCSEYMVICIERYGLIRGIKKGWARMQRCHDPNCGIDYPD